MLKALLAALVVVLIAVALLIPYLTRMPGKRTTGLSPLTRDEVAIRDRLRAHVQLLAGTIGERNMPRYANLQLARDYILRELTSMGYQPEQQPYVVNGVDVSNIIVEIPGATRPSEVVIFGAHYDTVVGTPGANDNASGVASNLELAHMWRKMDPAATVRFIFFVNEEPPYFQTDYMGSVNYARRCRHRKENIVAMFSLETMGYYSDESRSQQYPTELAALYPHTGNFIAFASNVGSAALLRHSVEAFRSDTSLPAEGGAAPETIPGIGWSDHSSFWREGYPAVMVTDTAPYRYPQYHASTDTPDRIDYDRLARCVTGLAGVLRKLSS